MSRARGAGIAAVLLLVVAACSASAAPDPASAAPVPPTAPAPTRRPPPIKPIGSIVDLTQQQVTIDDLHLTMRLPAGWQEGSIDDLRRSVEALIANADNKTKAALQASLADLKAGRMKLYAFGPSGYQDWRGSMGLLVLTDASKQAAADRIETRDRTQVTGLRSERRIVDLEIGPAIRLDESAPVPAEMQATAIPSHSITYFVQLDDG
ncbi:MAG TPA: hypothetical protein VID95_03905, partial [Candidatus Limnocylindrales bacterium]